MAKQTFTTGQVLTAAQMTSLQETAMGGGPATAKTASYVLVAADAGKTVAMNAAGATTITVNTGLFAAGDTVFIQNLGAGACTVTAGTATVATAGSLILPQNDAGILYFTSASAAIFYDYIQAGAVSPLTTKGDLYTFSTSDARLGVGANGTTLVADSSEATGLKWATPSSGGMTLITSGTLSGAAVDLTSISGYNDLQLVLRDFFPTNSGTSVRLRLNADSGANYSSVSYAVRSTALDLGNGTNQWSFNDGATQDANSDSDSHLIFTFFDYANTSTKKVCQMLHTYNNSGVKLYGMTCSYNTAGAITQLNLSCGSGNFGGGTYRLYGVK